MSVQNGIGYLRATYNPDLHFTENSDAYANLMYPYIQSDGGNTKNVSLSVDVINSDKNFATKNNYKEQEWSINETNGGNLLLDQVIWGFKEATHNTRDSKALNNAFCFNDQTVTIKITKQGHLQGYIDNDYLYAKNEIELSVVDVVRGKETTLATYKDLESGIDEENRSLQWSIPSKSKGFYLNYGFFGLFVFRIKVTSGYYIDARRNVKSSYQDRITNAYLQLLTFSADQEAVNVQSDSINIFEGNPQPNDSLTDLFDKSIFASLEQYNQNPLSGSQKKAIIADQIAVLFMSQHPVVSSDITPSKIQGFGGEKAIQPQKIIEKAITYAERYDPDVIQLAQNRLFGMLANYKTFSFADEINNLFSSTNQSAQNLVEPTRIIYMDEYGDLSDDMGVDGILFTPYVVENVHTEILSNVPPAEAYEIPLYKYSVGIDTLVVTDLSDENLGCGDTDIKLAFNVIFGDNKIDKIYYQVWLRNNKSYLEYVDKSGTSTDHSFDFSAPGGISCTYSGGSLTLGDIVTARVTIIDIYGFSNVFERKLFIPLNNDRPAITEITSFQRQDGSGLIDVFYHYQGTSEVNAANVSLTYSTNNSSFSSVSTNVIGDIGLGIMPGHRKITWNPTSVLSSSNDVVFVKITLTDVDEYSNAGITESSVVVVDLTTPEVSIRKLSLEEDEDMEESSSLSDSSETSLSSESSESSMGYSTSSSQSDGPSSESSSSSEGYSESSSTSSEGYSESSSTSSEGYSESSSSQSDSSSSSEGYSESSSTSSEGYSESSSSQSESSSSEMYSESSSTSSFMYSESSSSTSGDFEIVDGDSNYISMSVINGRPAIAYVPVSSSNVSYIRSDDVNGESWSDSPLGVGSGDRYPSLLTVSSRPCIAAVVGPSSNQARFSRASNVDGSNWGTPIVNVLIGSNATQFTDLKIISGNPAVVYDSSFLTYVRATNSTGTSWGTPVTISSNTTRGSLNTVSSRPAISFVNYSTQDLMYLRADDSTGSAWTATPIAVDAIGTGSALSVLEIINGRPAIAYSLSDGSLMYIRADDSTGSAWTATPITVDSGASITWKSMIVVNGNPAIAYVSGSSELMYIRADDSTGSAWTATPITVDGNNAGQYNSMQVVNGNPAIAYKGNSQLKYIRAKDANGDSW